MVKLEELFANEENRVLCLGNEAIARGAIEAGVQLFAAYPGTPSSEASTAIIAASKKLGFYAEWSTNEKVAFETAYAASISGARAMTACKHVGINVLADALYSAAYMGTKGGFVLLVGDDPHCFSSQNEQDSRWLGVSAQVPVLEPSNPQEAKEFTKLAFEISEKFESILVVRSTTRISHARSDVQFDKYETSFREGDFEKSNRYKCLPALARANHPKLVSKMETIKEWISESGLSVIEGQNDTEYGIITSGISYAYVKDALEILDKDVPVLKLGMVAPLDEKSILEFARDKKNIIFIEEVDPYLEDRISALFIQNGIVPKIHGKCTGITKKYHELNSRLVAEALQSVIGGKLASVGEIQKAEEEITDFIPFRPPLFCPGCQHRAAFWELSKVVRKNKGIFASDIGCYSLDPWVTDTILCMGAGISMANGFSRVIKDKPIFAYIGDSTFFHTGLTALANAVYHKANINVLVLDNRMTAMTGFQPNPTEVIDIADVAKSLGVEYVVEFDPYDFENGKKIFEDALQHEGPTVIIMRKICANEWWRQQRRSGQKIEVYHIDPETCIACGTCIVQYQCPAIYWSIDTNSKGKKYSVIDPSICTGCSVCSQICPVEAISKAVDTDE
ncbi:MAG: indolepyruvate ferredoxin oxidoreductase subunit alpha [Candidatus Heimdallarchaeota archaeon]|nr:indolepyruvate ferredoxin oxidoreductase subunit alpha [Candidatus Heimdallarchaeota archaeon]MCG3255902.1 indolepyruvate ferredoxin oxidoreductase subunit alpha [Candidatus Heimdallarchaeota archaeon]MCK4610973.1 indolepyruvate ferredoxin oxidoreductase subunit alpha [Candidatus Heimdallarchaeota archaeon]